MGGGLVVVSISVAAAAAARRRSSSVERIQSPYSRRHVSSVDCGDFYFQVGKTVSLTESVTDTDAYIDLPFQSVMARFEVTFKRLVQTSMTCTIAHTEGIFQRLQRMKHCHAGALLFGHLANKKHHFAECIFLHLDKK